MGEDTFPFSLYLDLEDGEKAELEVIARASLALVRAIDELAFVIDPSLKIRIELASGSEGSLSLNSLIRLLLDKASPQNKATLKAIIIVVLGWFAADVRATLTGDYLHHLLGADEHRSLSEEEIKEITQVVEKAERAEVAKDEVRRVYKSLQADPAIKGVGATVTPGQKPDAIVPKAEFPSRSGDHPQPEISIPKRQRHEEKQLTLVSPILTPSLTRKWRFQSNEGAISAPIKDAAFLLRLLSGQERIPMRANIVMDVLLEITEEFKDGAWVITDRSILEVKHVRAASVTGNLFAPPAVEDDDGN